MAVGIVAGTMLYERFAEIAAKDEDAFSYPEVSGPNIPFELSLSKLDSLALMLEFDPVILGYPETFANESAQSVALHFARTEDSAARLSAYVIYDAMNDRPVQEKSFGVDGPPIPHQPCRSHKDAGCEYEGRLLLETDSLAPGPYYVVLHDSDGMRSQQIYFLLRPAPDDVISDAVLLVYPVFTWQAYDRAGGQSMYRPLRSDKKYEVSQLRPQNTSIGADSTNPRSTIAFARLLKEIGIPMVGVTSMDLHLRPQYLDRVKVVILTVHDEYWTHNMRQAIDGYLERGGRIAVFAGSVGWWKLWVRGNGNLYVNRNHVNDTGEIPGGTGLWRQPWIDHPIEATLGLSYQSGGYPIYRRHSLEQALARHVTREQYARSSGITIVDPGHRIFSGTGLKKGDLFGAALNVVDGELDGAPLLADGSVDFTWMPHIPRNMRILGTAFMFNANFPRVHRRPSGRFHIGGIIAEVARANGAKVLHFGSIGWFNAIGSGDPTAKQIFINTVEYLRDD